MRVWGNVYNTTSSLNELVLQISSPTQVLLYIGTSFCLFNLFFCLFAFLLVFAFFSHVWHLVIRHDQIATFKLTSSLSNIQSIGRYTRQIQKRPSRNGRRTHVLNFARRNDIIEIMLSLFMALGTFKIWLNNLYCLLYPVPMQFQIIQMTCSLSYSLFFIS